MLQNFPISDIMTDDIEVVEEHQTLKEVLDILSDLSVQHIPVVSKGELVGLVSSSDIMDHTIDILNESNKPSSTRENIDETNIKEIMSTELITLTSNCTVLDAAEILSRGDIHSIPIVDKSNMIVGIVTSTDLIKYLMNQLQLES